MPPLLDFIQFAAQLIPGKVLYFPCDELNTEEPHYFVYVVKENDDIHLLSCGTSQLNTMRALVDIKRFLPETIIFMSAGDSENPFIKDTFINCNEYFLYGVEELWYLYTEGLLTIKGDIPLDSYHQIVIGFHKSPLIPTEIKELMPGPDSF